MWDTKSKYDRSNAKNRFMQIRKGDMGYWLFAYQVGIEI